MAKSLGNFFTVKDLLEKGVPGEVIRFVLLSAQYRQPLDWTENRVEEVTTLLTNWARLKRKSQEEGFISEDLKGIPDPRFVDALSDDLNTPKAISVLHEMAGEARLGGVQNPDSPRNFFATLKWLGFDLTGLLTPAIRVSVDAALNVASGAGAAAGIRTASAVGSAVASAAGHAAGKATASAEGADVALVDRVNRVVQKRAEARRDKNFRLADAFRDGLAEAGVILEDTPTGTDWESAEIDAAKLKEVEAL